MLVFMNVGTGSGHNSSYVWLKELHEDHNKPQLLCAARWCVRCVLFFTKVALTGDLLALIFCVKDTKITSYGVIFTMWCIKPPKTSFCGYLGFTLLRSAEDQ